MYPELWEDLKPFVSEEIDDLSRMIQNYTFGDAYSRVKDTFCFKDHVDWLLTAIHNGLASRTAKKRVICPVKAENGLSAGTLSLLRKASCYGDELLVLLVGQKRVNWGRNPLTRTVAV